jgi:hypothetical protein
MDMVVVTKDMTEDGQLVDKIFTIGLLADKGVLHVAVRARGKGVEITCRQTVVVRRETCWKHSSSVTGKAAFQRQSGDA